MFFFGGWVFWHEQLIKFFLASTCDFSSLPPSLPPSLLLPALISTKPSQRCIRVPGHHSWSSRFPILFFFSFFQGGVLFTTQVYYLPLRITPFSNTRKRERARKERKKKKTSFLVSAVFEPKHTHIHTSLPTYTPIASSKPPVRIQKSIVYLPTLPTYLGT